MNPAEGRIPGVRIEVRVDRDTLLPGHVWCSDRPRALVAIAHGLGEHSARYAALAEHLVDRRFTVAALDLPGNGEAPGPRGHAKSWLFLRDQVLPATFTAAHGMPGQPADLPVIVLGHSMGGLLVLDYALAHPKRILAVVASAPSIRVPAPPGWKVALARVADAIAPSMGFDAGLDQDNMSRDPLVRDLRAIDPLVHDKISPRLYFGFAEAQHRVLADSRRLAVPTLILQGTGDKVVDPKGALEFNVGGPHAMVRLNIYPGGYHEIFNDTERAQAIKDLVGWLDAVVVV